ncbi:Glf protein [Pedobacter sp. BAL39]|uniref:UDP-galactopyranose mutase n=1 Tax=Pedobacter sp. BAL39 TaxID=391596 RepID=UPI0001559CB3|nr:UDP-galactopyranose mutase [Pedobacter sp. BAL39]EDM37810.1 Glf protein [Pedobacter sp. BAL39]
MYTYDYVIIGSGLFGAVFAHEMNKVGRKCIVIEKRNHIGGNIYTHKTEGINIHKYGAHIFHTDDKAVWDYVSQFTSFNNFINSPLANYNGKLFNLPFNMNTFYQLWGTITPAEAKYKIAQETKAYRLAQPKNLEEHALASVGLEIYLKFIKAYTEKQWGMSPTRLPASILKRIPIRFTYDNNYFKHRYQGIPVGGYTSIISKLLDGIETKLNTDFHASPDEFRSLGRKLIFSGKIDEYYNYRFGALDYRSLRFEEETLDIENFQGNAVVNYTGDNHQFTRIYEHKHFEFGTQGKTVITREYPIKYTRDVEPYYPINDVLNNDTYNRYKKLAQTDGKVIFGGRLGDYKYYDMHQVIGSALSKSKKEILATKHIYEK